MSKDEQISIDIPFETPSFELCVKDGEWVTLYGFGSTTKEFIHSVLEIIKNDAKEFVLSLAGSKPVTFATLKETIRDRNAINTNNDVVIILLDSESKTVYATFGYGSDFRKIFNYR